MSLCSFSLRDRRRPKRRHSVPLRSMLAAVPYFKLVDQLVYSVIIYSYSSATYESYYAFLLPLRLVGRLFPKPKNAAPSAARVCVFRRRYAVVVGAGDVAVGVVGEPTEQTAAALLGSLRCIVGGSPARARCIHRGLCGHF